MSKHKSTMKKIITGAVAFSLITGAAIPTLYSQVPIVKAAESGITPFVDVPAGLYAEKHIYRLSLQQIVKGYENKATGEFTFNYGNTISQQEAVIMAIRFAGMEHLLDHFGMIVFQDGFFVKEDYKPYIELAFEKGLLDRQEEYAIAESEPNVQWGAKPATREWVTKLIIRAIGANAKAKELSDSPTKFADHSLIDEKYVGYVNAAVELGLVKGLTETQFGPTTAINRASFATILSRAQKDFPIEANGQVYGIVTKITDSFISVYANGKETNYAIDKTTGFYVVDNDFAIKKDAIKLYSNIAIIHVNGVAKFVESQGEEQNVVVLNAPIGIINEKEKIIYLTVDDHPLRVPLDSNTQILDSAGEAIKFEALKVGSNVKVTFDDFRNVQQVISVELVTGGQNEVTEISGVFFNYDESTKLLTLKTEKGFVSKVVVKNPTISIPYIGFATIDDFIKDSDLVTVKVNAKDEVVAISIPEQDYEEIYLPTIVNVDEDRELITVIDASGLNAEVLYYNDQTRFLLDGAYIGNRYVKNPFESNAVVIKYAVNEGKKQIVYYDIISELTAQVEEFNYFDKWVKLVLPDGSVTKLEYANSSTTMFTDKKRDLLDVKKGETITVDLSSETGMITDFRLHETHTMTISKLTGTTKQIDLKLNDVTQSVLYDEVEIVSNDGNKIEYSKLKTNQTVVVQFKGKVISKIIVMS